MTTAPRSTVAGSSRFIADKAALDRLLSGPDGPVAADLSRRVVRIERAAKRLCPVDTGRLRSSAAHSTPTPSQHRAPPGS